MGPLSGVRVVELAGIGPAPFAGMLLADLGAEVLRVDRPGDPSPSASGGDAPTDLLNRGKSSVAINLKDLDGIETVLRLIDRADVLIEGFRPGVTERLGIGPEVCCARNPQLVYARMTGWGQDGPNAPLAGHDINYIALSGVLAHIGRPGTPPAPPLNLVGDFGGGGMLVGFGVVCALLERNTSGRGQVVDAAMVDGAALLATYVHGLRADGKWSLERGVNPLDGGAPYYDTYPTSDGKFISIGAIESKFYVALIDALGMDRSALPDRDDPAVWPALKAQIAAVIRTRTRDDWIRELADVDACFAPVLDMEEAYLHAHNQARGTFVMRDGVHQPAPAPRFSRTPGAIRASPPVPGRDTSSALTKWGFTQAEISGLRVNGTIAGPG